MSYRLAGQYERAIEDFDQAIELKSHYAEAFNNRGLAYRELGDSERAVQDFNEAIRLNPQYIEAFNNRAWTRYLQGQNAEALEDAAHAIEISMRPNPRSLNAKAHALAALGRQDEALVSYVRVMGLGGAPWVREYQRALKRHGHDPGLTDGKFRPETLTALKACLRAGCRLMK